MAIRRSPSMWRFQSNLKGAADGSQEVFIQVIFWSNEDLLLIWYIINRLIGFAFEMVFTKWTRKGKWFSQNEQGKGIAKNMWHCACLVWNKPSTTIIDLPNRHNHHRLIIQHMANIRNKPSTTKINQGWHWAASYVMYHYFFTRNKKLPSGEAKYFKIKGKFAWPQDWTLHKVGL